MPIFVIPDNSGGGGGGLTPDTAFALITNAVINTAAVSAVSFSSIDSVSWASIDLGDTTLINLDAGVYSFSFSSATTGANATVRYITARIIGAGNLSGSWFGPESLIANVNTGAALGFSSPTVEIPTADTFSLQLNSSGGAISTSSGFVLITKLA